MLVEFSTADPYHLPPWRCTACITWSVSCFLSCSSTWIIFHMMLKMCSPSPGHKQVNSLAIRLRGSLLGSEQKTHYPQWTKATERWFPLWKPLIPLLWAGGRGWKCEKVLQERSCTLAASCMGAWYLQGPSTPDCHWRKKINSVAYSLTTVL